MTPPLPREQFPVVERLRYFDHAGVAPLSKAAADAIAAYATDAAARGVTGWKEREDRQEEVRATAAALMGVPATDIAFVKNTTEGIAFVAHGLDWQPGDRVLVPDLEFPSTVYPWLALRDRGVEVDFLSPVGDGRAVPLELVENALAARPTKLVCVSWVQYGRGWRIDLAGLAKVCHEHGALLCADVIQGVGVVPADLAAWDVDFASADSHKWMLGPEGVGVLYVAAHRRDLIRPLEPGWASVVHRRQWSNLDLVWDDSARRFEGGSYNLAGISGMGASLDLLTATGVEAIWAHVDELCDRLVDGLAAVGATVLSDRSPEGRSGIVTFEVEGLKARTAYEQLDKEGFVCSPRGGGVRVSPHGYNDEEEIDALVAAIERLRN